MDTKLDRIQFIDGLRALAVLCVLVYHLFPAALPGGFVGVDVFFVISGYVVCASLLKTSATSFWEFATRFYARRVLRIYPALTAMLVVVGLLARLFIPDCALAGSSRNTGFAAFFGLSNVQLVLKSDGYFTPTGDFNPYLHTWSLGIEEQFYFLFPILLFVDTYWKQRRGTVAGRLANLLLPLLFCVSLAVACWETLWRHDAAYYLLPSRFWELALGALLCQWHSRTVYHLPRAGLLAYCGLVALGLALVCTNERWFPFPWALVPAVGTALCISGVRDAAPTHLVSIILSSPPAMYVGRLSYSLYLWHWPALVLLRWTTGLESVPSVMAAVSITALCACLSYHYIEKPFQSLRVLQDQWFRFVVSRDPVAAAPRHVLFTLPTNVAMIGTAIALLAIFSNLHAYCSRSTTLPLSVTMRSGGDPNPWRPFGRGVSHQKLVAGEKGRIWSGKRLFALGDSHASAYVEMLSDLRQREGVSIYLYSIGDVRIGSFLHPQRDWDRAAEHAALEALKRYAQPGDIVLLSSLRVLRIGTQWQTHNLDEVIADRDSERAERNRELAVQEGKALIAKLEEMGLTVLVEAPKPIFAAPAFRCSDWFNRINPIGKPGFVMDRNFLLEHRSAAMRSIQEVRQDHPEVRVWDPLQVLCPDTKCYAFENGKPLFFDNDHLSSYGNQKLYPDFVKQIDALWGNVNSVARSD
jgi:peptidoglycan/LPS O-acetylase OafA/YrhL